jgi:hypothetical protein
MREDKSEFLPWLLLRIARYWYNSIYSITSKCWVCCCCCKGLRKGEVWYAVDMTWFRVKEGRGSTKVDKLRAKVAFDSLEFNHMRVQYNYGDRLAAAMTNEFKKTIKKWMAVDKEYHQISLACMADFGARDDIPDADFKSLKQGIEQTNLGDIPERFNEIMNVGVDEAGWGKFVRECNDRYAVHDKYHAKLEENKGKVEAEAKAEAESSSSSPRSKIFKFWPNADKSETTRDVMFGTDPMSIGGLRVDGSVRGLRASRQDSRRTSSFCNMFSSRLRVALIWSKFQEDEERLEKTKKAKKYFCGCAPAKLDPLYVPAGGLFHVSGFQSFHLLYQLSKKARWCVNRLHEKIDHEMKMAKDALAKNNGKEANNIYLSARRLHSGYTVAGENKEGDETNTSTVPPNEKKEVRDEELRRHDAKGWATIKKDSFDRALKDLLR